MLFAMPARHMPCSRTSANASWAALRVVCLSFVADVIKTSLVLVPHKCSLEAPLSSSHCEPGLLNFIKRLRHCAHSLAVAQSVSVIWRVLEASVFSRASGCS